MRMREQRRAELVWVTTDEDGEIEALSPTAGELLGLRGMRARGQNLFLFFPMSVRAMALDAETACSGWPNGRTVLLEPLTRQSLNVRYLVSADTGTGTLRLNWFFDVDTSGQTTH
jgi:hypothetical protein